jgi:hypothetical protein
VRIWTNGFQDRLEGLFKRFALGRGSHLALQPDRPGELGERTLVPVLVADRGVDKFMRQNASDPQRIVQDWRDHHLAMSIRAVRIRPALTQTLFFCGERTDAREAAGKSDFVWDLRATRREHWSKPLRDGVQPCLAMFKRIYSH